jgi:hypothetical protein
MMAGRSLAAAAAALWLLAHPAASSAEPRPESVDTALVLAVDVSGSVSSERFALQMEGIARAFEDSGVQSAIMSGPRHAIFVTLVEWSNRATVSVPWTLITDAEDARTFATKVRRAPRADSQFTCMATALQLAGNKVLPFLPVPATRRIIDVSGDGRDNCNQRPVDQVRDELVAAGITINGLPILEGDEAASLAPWYHDHVIGGPGAFLLPAASFKDFGRAMRDKFIVEISAVAAPTGG